MYDQVPDQDITAEYAPGAPGVPPRWTSAAKNGVGTATTAASRVWFTISHGILNEVYYPRTDHACTRDMELLVTGPGGFFSEEKRHTIHQTRWIEAGVPAYELINTCTQGRYRIVKRIIADPRRDVVLQHVRFEALKGEPSDYRLYALLAPHLVNGGAHNTGWLDDYKGMPLMLATGDGDSLAFACSVPWLKRSAGFVGFSDGWQIVKQHGDLAETYARAEDGNIALTGEIDVTEAAGRHGVVLALGFGHRAREAAQRACASIMDGFGAALEMYAAGWRQAQSKVCGPKLRVPGKPRDLAPVSVAVMLTHEAISFPGAIIASLSIPWGYEKGDDDIGGYHLVWPRDLVESAGGLLAAGLGEHALNVLNYLQVTQEPNGGWAQNMWLDGAPYWTGVQLDECAFPILLVDMIRREQVLEDHAIRRRYLPMVRRAARFVLLHGPVTGQDRWEEDSGYSPFTLAVCISAFLAAAEMLEADDPVAAQFLRDTADAWNDGIDRWTYVTGTPLAEEVGVPGYYVRIAPPGSVHAVSSPDTRVLVKNRPMEAADRAAGEIVSPDALALVRFGLRAADDPKILDTIKVIDRLLKAELPHGPVWHRYNEDGYGEYPDGRPFDGQGIGRCWPLLTGERAHYAIAAGDMAAARSLLDTMEACANEGGMLPEQVWDSEDIPERELFRGRPSGSAMPLVWAHSEHLKVLRSLHEGQVFDMPTQTVKRYVVDKVGSSRKFWRDSHRPHLIPVGMELRVELEQSGRIFWFVPGSPSGIRATTEVPTTDSHLGIHYADIPTSTFPIGTEVSFNIRFDEPQGEPVAGLDDARRRHPPISVDETYMLAIVEEAQADLDPEA
ncbi:MAG TPA: glucan 1,4-alpha-glucosidase [Stellaceae bacterium]|nr:glucan 1,4-alpha-glucosidase [Stellaceae bacterium]